MTSSPKSDLSAEVSLDLAHLRLPFSALVRALGSPDQSELKTTLRLPVERLDRFAVYGCDVTQARNLAARAKLDPAAVWPQLAAATTAPPKLTSWEIAWDDEPPGANSIIRRFVDNLESFRVDPGRWGRLPEDVAPATVTALRKSTGAGRWQIVGTKVPGSKPVRCVVRVRYLGPETEA